MGLLKALSERKRLQKDRREYSRAFANMMREHAKVHSLDEDFSYLCGLLHNIGEVNVGGVNSIDTILILQNENLTDVAAVVAGFYAIEELIDSEIANAEILASYAKLMHEVSKMFK